jgi:uncharacterized protein (TIGR03437 family)
MMRKLGLVLALLFCFFSVETNLSAQTVGSVVTITNSPPGGTVGSPYSFQFTATGGTPPYTWTEFGRPSDVPGPSLTAGRLKILTTSGFGVPPGLEFNGGLISGIPSQAGSYTFNVEVEDSDQNFGHGQFTIGISPCYPSFVTKSPLPNAEVDVAYSLTFQASGCSGSYTFSAPPSNPLDPTSVPAGMTFSSSGLLNGAPNNTGTSNLSVSVYDNGEGPSSQTSGSFLLTVNPPPSVSTASPLPPGPAGQPYTQTFAGTGGVAPYTFTVQNLPPGFNVNSAGVLTVASPAAGTFTFSVAVIDSARITSAFKQFQVTFTQSGPLLQVSPTSLTFAAVAQGDPPASQAISVAPLASGGTPTFQVLVDAGTANTTSPFSLTVKPASATAPEQLVVTVDQGSMPAGSSSARIRIIDSNKVEYDVSVTLNVSTASAQLQVIPASLRFGARSQSPGVLVQDVVVTSSGGGGPLGFSTSVLGGSSWISQIAPSSSQTVRGAKVFLQVIVNTQGLQVGSYRDTIQFSSSAGNVLVPVSLFVAASGPIISVNVTGLRFQARQGGGFSNAQKVSVLNTGDPTSTVDWSASLVTGGNVFSLSPASGTATASTPGSLTISPSQSATQATPGGYYALVSISDPKSLNSPQYVVAVLDLESSSTPALPDPSPAGLFFTAVSGAAQTATQTVTVNTSSSTAVPFQVAATTTDGASWVVLTPTSGSSTGQTAGTFTVSVNPATLAAGIYTGQVSVSMSGAVRTVNITAVVLPVGSAVHAATAEGLALPLQAAGCTPSKLALTETGLVNNFAVPASWPATLIVRLNDDCGGAVTNGAVVASFSNGDPPLSLLGAGQGNTYSATWQPGVVTSQIVVTLNGSAGNLQPVVTVLNGGVAQNPVPAPVLAKGGTVAPFYRVSGGPLSPGTIVEVYGTGLASGTVSTGAPPLPKTFNGTYVLVGGLSAPLFFLSSGQLDVQIPIELPANQQPLIIVSANGAPTLPDQLDVVPLQPVVDAFATGQLVAQHSADYTLVSSSSPAKPGEALVIYLLGMGPTNPSVASGAPAPSSPAAMVTAQPVITVNGINAQVLFAGFSPGFAGLYQVDFVVPSLTSGNWTVLINQNGVAANTTTLPVSN